MSFREKNAFRKASLSLLCVLLLSSNGFAISISNPLLFQIQPLTKDSQLLRDSAGKVIARLEPNGTSTTYSYNTQNKLSRIQYPNGETILFTYGTNQINMADTTGVWQYFYDTAGRVTQVISPDGESIRYAYDNAGNRITATSLVGTKTWQYDSFRRVVSVTDPKGRITQFKYDIAGRRFETLYPNGMKCKYQYDGTNRPTELTYYDNTGRVIATFRYEYDAQGNVLSSQNLFGITRYTYDSSNRLTSALYPDNSFEVFMYDGNGRRASFRERNGKVHVYSYDNTGKLRSTGDEQFQYDAYGNRSKIFLAQKETATYFYDGENRLVQMDEKSGVTQKHLVSGWNGFALSSPVLNSLISEIFANFQFQSQIYQISRWNPSAQNGVGAWEHYVGDPRLNDFDTFEYGAGYYIQVLDPSGINISLSNEPVPANASMTLEKGWNLVGIPGNKPLTVAEAFSNLVYGEDYLDVAQSSENVYRYYSTGELQILLPGQVYLIYAKKIVSWKLPVAPGNQMKRGFNGLGKKVWEGEGDKQVRFYFDEDRLDFEKNSAGQIQRSYMPGPVSHEWLYQEDSKTGLLYFVQDAFGSICGLADETAKLVMFQTYNAFGKPAFSTPLTRLGFGGREYDSVTGLSTFDQASYDPARGFFVSPQPTTANLDDVYAFRKHNPFREFLAPRNEISLQNPLNAPLSIEKTVSLSLPTQCGALNGKIVLESNAMLVSFETNTTSRQVALNGDRFLCYSLAKMQPFQTGENIVLKVRMPAGRPMTVRLSEIRASSPTGVPVLLQDFVTTIHS